MKDCNTCGESFPEEDNEFCPVCGEDYKDDSNLPYGLEDDFDLKSDEVLHPQGSLYPHKSKNPESIEYDVFLVEGKTGIIDSILAQNLNRSAAWTTQMAYKGNLKPVMRESGSYAIGDNIDGQKMERSR